MRAGTSHHYPVRRLAFQGHIFAGTGVKAQAAHSSRKDLLNAGEDAAFAWSFDVETFPSVEFTVRFADDQDLNWEVGPDLRLKKLPARDW